MKNIYKKITKLFDKNKNISVWLENVKYWIPFLVIIVPVSVLVFISYKSRPVFSPPIYQAGIFQDSDEINLKIQPVLLSKYKYQNSNSFHQTSFQQDPTSSAAIHFTNKYSNFSFFTNSNQSFGSANKKVKPKTKDNEIIYSSLFPNTDLKYTINPNQILEEFIVRDKNTALKMLEISQTLDRSSIDSYKEMEDGSIELFYKEKLVATIPIPVMYELNDKTSRSYDLEYLVEKIDDDTLSITKSITEKGQEWLTSKDRTYPIVIDLVIDNADTAASWISSDTISSTVSQETTIKQEGTGSVKVATTAESSTNVDLMEYSTDAAAQAAYVTNESGISASGGTITYDGAYTIHTFDVNDTFVVNTGSGNVETLVVGGGGGTGSYYQGGGGGGGGIVYHSGYSVTTGSYPITVGVGGSGSIIGAQTQASGGNSVFGNMTAYGGGRGGSAGVARSNGGSAGGPSHAANQAASTATQGVNGTARYGNGAGANTGSSSPFSAPGGGGAGAAAVAIDESASSPGSGGNGRAFSISGSSVYYGGGGGGSNRGSTTGSGGLGGGGATGVSGTANTGGGGGAGSHASSPTRAGGAGGSGVVILKYLTPLQSFSSSSGITATGGTKTYDGDHTIHTFTSSGTFTVTTNSDYLETLVVGGGGGTGSYYQGGGGGGGGIVYHSGYSVTTGSYPITVGVGGSGSIIGAQTQASGGNSVFGNMTAYGGGRGGSAGVARSNGGSAGGPSHAANQAASTATQGVNGTARYGNGAGANTGSSSPFSAPGGGGAGAAAVAIDESASSPGSGGNGRAFSISGSSVYYGGGGGGSNRGSTTGSGGLGGGGATGVSGTANTGGGGGAGSHASSPTRAGGAGGSGVVILRYETLVNPKSQGSYSLEGYANTTSLNKTLTKTLSPTIDLSGHNNINFDLRSSRTGSNIKIGIHDSGGTTTEITPNITSSGVFQNFDFDISGVSNANKDAVDQIIITIVNADAVNTFYVDNMTADGGSLNNTISLSKSATDLTGSTLSYWVRSDTTGSFARFQFGETVSSEQTSSFTINSANTWEQKTWDLSSISTDDRNEVTEFAFKFTSDTSGAILYFDDIQVGAPPPTPTPSPTPIPMDVLNGEPNGANACYLEESAQDDEVIVHWTDGATDEIGYEIERQDNGISWQTIDITSPNAESYSDDSVSSGNLYRYKIRKRTDDDGAGEWCGTPMIDLKTGSHQIEGFKIEGVRLD